MRPKGFSESGIGVVIRMQILYILHLNNHNQHYIHHTNQLFLYKYHLDMLMDMLNNLMRQNYYMFQLNKLFYLNYQDNDNLLYMLNNYLLLNHYIYQPGILLY